MMTVVLVVWILSVHLWTTASLVNGFLHLIVMFSSFTCSVISELSALSMKILALVALVALCQRVFGETVSCVPVCVLILSVNSSPTRVCVQVSASFLDPSWQNDRHLSFFIYLLAESTRQRMER